MHYFNVRSLLLALLVVFLLGTSGCRKVRMWTGIGLVVENAEEGSPEELIQKIFEAALLDSDSKGWNLYRKHIHPEKMKTVIQKEEWKIVKNMFDNKTVDKDHSLMYGFLTTWITSRNF